MARRTRETILLCEAAGYRNVLIETVGVGQSETAVRSMSDFFLLLMLAGAGDELQGIKRGIIEMIDGMAINKADGDNLKKAERARAEYASALHLFPPSGDGWTPQVVTCSAINNTGIAEIWQMVLEHEAQLGASGRIAERRTRGDLQWMEDLISMGLAEMFETQPAVARAAALAAARCLRGTYYAPGSKPRSAGTVSPARRHAVATKCAVPAIPRLALPASAAHRGA